MLMARSRYRPRRWMGAAGVFCDLQLCFFGVKLGWALHQDVHPRSEPEFWALTIIGASVSLLLRLAACAFVFTDAQRRQRATVAPASASHRPQGCLLPLRHVAPFVTAVRFFSLCDAKSRGHLTELDLRRVLAALNGGSGGIGDARFDPAYLARELMSDIGGATVGKVLMHEFLSAASAAPRGRAAAKGARSNPLIRLLHAPSMKRLLAALHRADTVGAGVLERAQLGIFCAHVGLRLTEDEMDALFLRMPLDDAGCVSLFDVIGHITAVAAPPPGVRAALPPAWAATAPPDPVQLLKIAHDDGDERAVHPSLTSRARVTFAVPLDPRHVENPPERAGGMPAGPEETLPSAARGTTPIFFAPPPPPPPRVRDMGWQPPRTAPSEVLRDRAGAPQYTYNLALTEWLRHRAGDDGRADMVEAAMRRIYDHCDHDPENALRIFREIDVDGSGEVDYTEFEQGLRRMGVQLEHTQVQW
jgi:Ca2+-binding EF-hand superfamily protein